eukprot:CAMPEP_0115324830 /NCGR_PEP_ID=MMETSP0270-20121206/82688_1 /TAXON_ID=71861 /ORGANISM="Scrippsiella trochoidea, Strain CCMP3099" /LENGTH=116 /DNA_ID=CAMNT_0002744975 /DNA_START=43 /DNA_END=388 /DNA_ORIENTATION=+
MPQWTPVTQLYTDEAGEDYIAEAACCEEAAASSAPSSPSARFGGGAEEVMGHTTLGGGPPLLCAAGSAAPLAGPAPATREAGSASRGRIPRLGPHPAAVPRWAARRSARAAAAAAP